MIRGAHLIEAAVFSGAGSRAFLDALISAYENGPVAIMSPVSGTVRSVPGVKILDRFDFAPDPGWFQRAFTPPDNDGLAQISFSSGTTGRPKPIVLSHRALADAVARLNEAMRVDNSIREYVGAPVNFSFGLGRARAVAAAGGAAFLPPHGFNPSELASMLKKGEANAVSAVPTQWRILLQNEDIVGAAGKRVKWIEIGSQYMSRAEKEAMKRLFPNAVILQHYGLTEASRSTFLDISATDGEALESVGKPYGRTEVKLSDDGRIMIRGPHVAEGLATGAGVKPVAAADGWLTTNDLGEIRDGFVYFRGRADDLINCGGIKIDPEQFEQKLGAAVGASGAIAVARIADPLRGERILVALKRGAADPEKVRTAAAALAGDYGLVGAASLSFAETDDFPTTTTGKLKRAALAAHVVAEAPQNNTPPQRQAHKIDQVDGDYLRAATPIERAEKLKAIWLAGLGLDDISYHENFYDLGGDSLSAVTVMLSMERLGLPPEIAAGILEGKSIAEIVGLDAGAAPDAPTSDVAAASRKSGLTIASAVNAIQACRGVLVGLVVFAHWGPGLLQRLTPQAGEILSALNPFIRFGTPGFALVFGLGVGALSAPQFMQNPDRFRKSKRVATWLLFASVILLAAIWGVEMWTEGKLTGPYVLSGLFYSAITYYYLISVALGAVLWLATRGKRITLNFLLIGAALFFMHAALYPTLGQAPLTGFPELLKILTFAKYGFLRMTAAVMLGAAIGWHFRRNFETQGVIGNYATAGVAMALFSGALTLRAGGVESLLKVDAVEPWHLIGYAGLTTLLLAGFAMLTRPGGSSGGVKLATTIAIVAGAMALPIYVGHAAVRPVAGILEHFGAPGAVALGAPMLAFIALIAWGGSKLYRIYAR